MSQILMIKLKWKRGDPGDWKFRQWGKWITALLLKFPVSPSLSFNHSFVKEEKKRSICLSNTFSRLEHFPTDSSAPLWIIKFISLSSAWMQCFNFSLFSLPMPSTIIIARQYCWLLMLCPSYYISYLMNLYGLVILDNSMD